MGRESEETGQLGYKRLVGLWLVCMLFAVAAVFSLEHVVRATWLGVVVFGGIGGALAAVAAGLWVRSRAAWLVALALLLPGALWVSSRVGVALSEGDGCACIGAAFLLISFASWVYLIWRRRHFGAPRANRPRLGSRLSVVTFSLLGVFGVVYALLMNVDDPPREFPELALERRSVRAEDNGYTILLQIHQDGLLKEPDPETPLYSAQPEAGTEEAQAWLAEARAVLEENAECLEKVDAMLSRPDFVLPPPISPWDLRADETMDALAETMRALARLLAWRSGVALAEGRVSDAMDDALGTVELGLRYGSAQGKLIDWLVGCAIVSVGLEQVRMVASSKSIQAELLAEALAALDVEDKSRQAYADCMRGELLWTKDLLRQTKTLAPLEPALLSPGLRFYRRCLRDPMPILKLNMSSNLMGELLRDVVRKSTGDLFPAGSLDVTGYPDELSAAPSHPGVIAWIRNPMGTMLVLMSEPAPGRSLELCLRDVARLRATRLFLALRSHSLERTSLPATLDELAPRYLQQVPPDPFSGRAFGYEPEASPPRLYSVGPDGQRDADGASKQERDDFVLDLTFAKAADHY